MFQNIKRAHFLSVNNFNHWNAGNAVRMYTWLKDHGWPADDFVDLYMKVTKDKSGYQSPFDSFELYLSSQFDWVNSSDPNSLSFLVGKLEGDKFLRNGSDKLLQWLKAVQADSGVSQSNS